MDLDCNKWKKRSVSLRSHSWQIEKKKRSFEKIFSLERSGGSSHHLNQSQNIFSIEWSRARFASKRTKKRARCSSFYTRRLGSLSRARERERFPSSPSGLFFSHVRFSYLLKLDTEKVNSERNARARSERARDLFPRTTMRRIKRSYLNLGGLEAGDGRDLLSSSKHYVCSKVDVFLCVWMTIYRKFENILYLAHQRFGQKEQKEAREEGTWEMRIEFFRKKREKRETF